MKGKAPARIARASEGSQRRRASGVHPRFAAERRPEVAATFSELTSLVFESLDYRATLARVARAIGGGLARGCAIELSGEPPLSIVCSPGDHEGVVLRAIGPVVATVMVTGIALSARDHLAQSSARTLRVDDVTCVPIRIHGETVGTLTLLGVRGIASPSTEQDVAQLARCMAAAVENGMLYERAVEGLRVRDEMLSTVSHDLKNPLGVILLTTSQLIEQAANEEGPEIPRRHIEAIRRSANRMHRLVGDLLDIAAIESGALVMDPTPCSVQVLVHEAIQAASAAAETACVTLEAELEDVPPVLADGERILQVLGNLLDNAIKFTGHRGRVVVRTEARLNDVAVHVEDAGSGICAAELPHVFDRFWQAAPTHRLGTGLGLAICKSLVERGGGSITAHSEMGVGTTMTFTLPRAQ